MFVTSHLDLLFDYPPTWTIRDRTKFKLSLHAALSPGPRKVLTIARVPPSGSDFLHISIVYACHLADKDGTWCLSCHHQSRTPNSQMWLARRQGYPKLLTAENTGKLIIRISRSSHLDFVHRLRQWDHLRWSMTSTGSTLGTTCECS